MILHIQVDLFLDMTVIDRFMLFRLMINMTIQSILSLFMNLIYSYGLLISQRGEIDMKCPICKLGKMQDGFTQVVLTRRNATVIFRNVPARICDDCGEYYLDEQIAQDLYNRADNCFTSGQEVAIVDYKQLASA